MDDEREQVLVVGPDGEPVAEQEHSVTGLVEQPAKVMRIGRMVQQLLEEVKAAPLDEPGRKRLARVLHTSINELKDGLAPELDDELDRLIEPFDEAPPTESELRIAQAQLVGWLEGLFHGIQTAIYAQQMAAKMQFEQMRRGLPAGMSAPQGEPEDPNQPPRPGDSGGMYL
jgi:proteasome activator-like protein